jgi:hypothetical protein
MSRIRLVVSTVVAVSSLVGIVLGALGLAVLFAADLPGLVLLPPSSRTAFVAFAFVALLVSWMLFYLERRAAVGELEARLRRSRDLQGAIDGLSTLRSEGVTALFASVPKPEEFETWVARFEDWERRVVDYMKPRFTAAIVGLFSELGAVPAISFAHASKDPSIASKHEARLRMIAKELAILERVIQQGSHLVNEPNPTAWEILWQRQQGG